MTLAQTAPQAHRITLEPHQALVRGNRALYAAQSTTASGQPLTYRIAGLRRYPTLFCRPGADRRRQRGRLHYSARSATASITHGRKSRIPRDAQSAKLRLGSGRSARAAGVRRGLARGACLRCGRVLTVPQSIAQGYGAGMHPARGQA